MEFEVQVEVVIAGGIFPLSAGRDVQRGFLLADREFVGQHWLSYLTHRHIRYHIRIRENF